MKIPTALLTTILSLTAGGAAAQSRDGATDAPTGGPSDAARPTDGHASDAAAVHDGAADGSHGGAAHDAAPAPATPFFFHENPGCSVGGRGAGGAWTLVSVGLMAVALVKSRRRRQT